MSNQYELRFSGQTQDLLPLLIALTQAFGEAPAIITNQVNYLVLISTPIDTEKKVKIELGDFPGIDITVTRIRQVS